MTTIDLKGGAGHKCQVAKDTGPGGFPAAELMERARAAEARALEARRALDEAVADLGITLKSSLAFDGAESVDFRVCASGLRVGPWYASHAEAARLRDFLSRMYGAAEAGPEMRASDRDELIARMCDRMVAAVPTILRINPADDRAMFIRKHTAELVVDVLDHVGVRLAGYGPGAPLVRIGPGGDFTHEIPARV